MQNNGVHVCLEQAEAPAQDGEFVDGARYVCSCGSHFVYREGFTMSGHRGMDWWPAPAIAVPEQRQARKSLRDRLIRPRNG
jgi:hypothetical protein